MEEHKRSKLTLGYADERGLLFIQHIRFNAATDYGLAFFILDCGFDSSFLID